MKVKVSDIVTRVYSLLDENEALLEERVEYDDPSTALKPLIIELLPDAARLVLSQSSLSEIDECHHGPLTMVTYRGDMAEMRLPENFLRLVNFKMSDWRGGVSIPMAYGGEARQLMLRRSAATDRRRFSPAVAIRNRGDISTLEIFNTAPGSKVEEFDWIEVPKISGAYIDLPPGLVSAVCSKLSEMTAAVID